MIRFFNIDDNIMASTTNGDENSSDCYCTGNPCNWYDWDVSIAVKGREDIKFALQQKLALLYHVMQLTPL